MKTPANRIIYLLLQNLAWFGVFPGIVEFFEYGLEHDFFPPQGDTIAIPIMNYLVMLVFLCPFLSWFSLCVLRKKQLPAPVLFLGNLGLINLLSSAACICFTVTIPWLLYGLYGEGPRKAALMEIPSALLGIYLVWSMRAVLTSGKKTGSAQ